MVLGFNDDLRIFSEKPRGVKMLFYFTSIELFNPDNIP